MTTQQKRFMPQIFMLALLLGMTLGGSRNVRAQAGSQSIEDRAKTVEVTIFAGVSATHNGENNSASLQVKTGVPFGGRIAYNFDNHSAVEFTVANPLSVYGNYVYNFTTSRAKLVPYLTAGIGAGRYGVELGDPNGTQNTNSMANDSGPDRRQTAFTTNFGGGVKYYLTERVALRLDARDIVGRYKATFTNVPGVPSGIVNGRRTLNDVQLTVGVVFSIGRR